MLPINENNDSESDDKPKIPASMENRYISKINQPMGVNQLMKEILGKNSAGNSENSAEKTNVCNTYF